MKAYKYGLKSPIDKMDIIDYQIMLSHRYRNNLIKIEIERREDVRSAQLKVPPVRKLSEKLDRCNAEIDGTIAEIKAIRAKSRTRVKTPELAEKVKNLKAERKELGIEVKKVKEEEKLRLKPLYEEINEKTNKAEKAARKAIVADGLYWGTYCFREKAAFASRKATCKNLGIEDDPTFRKWNGNGVLRVQIQGGLPSCNVFGDKNRLLQIAPVDEGAWLHEVRGERRRRCRTMLRIRISSDEKGKPVWGEFPMFMHRNLPEKSIIREAVVHRKIVGGKPRYSVSIVVDDSKSPLIAPKGRAIAAGIDVGWRKRSDGVRVAAWEGSDGNRGELVLPAKMLKAIKKVEELRSIRDKRRDLFSPMLIQWLKSNRLPRWLSEHTEHIGKWKAQSRFIKLWREWNENRFKGDEEIFAALSAWKAKDTHLFQWEANLRDKTFAHRKEVYRMFSAKIADKYEWLGIERFKLTDVNKKAEPEENKEEGSITNVTYFQNFAAVSILLDCLKQAFQARGGAVVKVPSENTTKTCFHCKKINEWDQAKEVDHVCDGCGIEWDQDENAAMNILELATDLVSSDKAA